MERVLITGATGFVGGNVAAQLAAGGAEVLCAVRTSPGPAFPWGWRITDLSSIEDVTNALQEFRATAVLHLAIDGDFQSLALNRRAGFDGYVGMTRRVVDAANVAGARVGYVSTDWVFDGTGHAVDEDEPVCPVNLYGTFKALSERVVLDRAVSGFVARVGGVQGWSIAKPAMPWEQNCGFGNLALAAVHAIRSGLDFDVWQDDAINGVASPITATEIGARLVLALRRGAHGVLHLAGADALTRLELVEAACDVFDLDKRRVRTGPVPTAQMLDQRMPFDTSLSTSRTDEVLGLQPHGIVDQLNALRVELETGKVSAPGVLRGSR